jgi:carbon-monoxide dehydrogenase iron sulfur subunit
MVRMVLHADSDLCTGCLSCMLACTFAKEQTFGLAHARLRVAKDEARGLCSVIVCHQCADAPCAAACPAEAIQRTEEGVLRIDEEECIGCGECAAACPFGVVALADGRPLKCDLCDGHPSCVQVCHSGALQFIPEDRIGAGKTQEALGVSTGPLATQEEQ